MIFGTRTERENDMERKLREITDRLEQIENMLKHLNPFDVKIDNWGAKFSPDCGCGTSARCFKHHPYGTLPSDILT